MSQEKMNEYQSSLANVYKDFFAIGAAVNPETLVSGKDLLVKHFNSLTAENHMKFENLQPQENIFTFEKSDELFSFAEANNMMVRGHTLVWHNQTPEWVFTDNGEAAGHEKLLSRMNQHISTVMGRYKGKVYSWDVVNEAVTDSGPELLRESKWLNGIGEDYIAKAFEFAHEADPNATLFYNDYNESSLEKSQKIYTLVKSLVDKSVPIHGVGLQAHWNLSQPPVDDIRAAIERYASLGLQIQITEMDVSMFEFEDKRADLVQPTNEMLELQQKRYDQFFSIFREYREVINSVTFWGVADDYTWLNDFPVKGRKNWPFVFDEVHQPKASFLKITNF